jgi:hypothetical protein
MLKMRVIVIGMTVMAIGKNFKLGELNERIIGIGVRIFIGKA